MPRTVALALAAALFLAPVFAGAPAAADEVADLVVAMARVGSASAPTFSPDGEWIAYVANLSGSPQVWRLPVAGGYPRQVTAFDDPAGSPSWSPDGSLLAFTVAPGGGLNQQVWVARPDGTGARRLTGGGRDNNWLARHWSPDGRAVAISSNRADPAAMDCYLLGLDGSHRLVARNRGIGTVADLSADGRRALVSRLGSRGSNDLFLVDLERGAETLLTAHDGPGTFDGELAPDGSTVYLLTNLGRDLAAFGRVRVADGGVSAVELLAERGDAELEAFTLDRAARTAALFWNVAGRSELSFLDLASGQERPVPALPAELAAGGEFSPDGALLVFSASGAAQPSDLFLAEVATGAVRRLTWSPHVGVDLDRLVRPELATYAAHDGLPLSGWLYRAPGADAPGAVVMSFHGGPEGQDRPAFQSTYQALLARGISVFAPNVRGSSGFGKRFVNLDNGALRADAVRDIKATIDHLVGTGLADPRRIGIAGGSYGGYMVMAGLADYPGEIAAGVNLFGVVNFETFFAHSEPWMAAISTVEYGDPATEREMLRALSPIHRLDRVTAPTLVLHGANDTNVPVVEAEQVVESLRRRGVPVELILFPDEGHGWRRLPNRVRSTVAIVDWFTRHLGEGAAPAP